MGGCRSGQGKDCTWQTQRVAWKRWESAKIACGPYNPLGLFGTCGRVPLTAFNGLFQPPALLVRKHAANFAFHAAMSTTCKASVDQKAMGITEQDGEATSL